MVHACTNNFPLTSGEVCNYYINWSKASFDFSIADIQEQNNVLHICWLCYKNACKNLGWHAKEQAFVIWFYEKPMCLDALLFRKSAHKELQFCSFKHSMLDPLEEPKYSSPNLYASDLAPCQIISMEIENGTSSQWVWVNCSFTLHTTYHVFGHFGFHWWCPYIQSSKQCTTYIYIYTHTHTHTYIYIYMPVKGNTRISLK